MVTKEILPNCFYMTNKFFFVSYFEEFMEVS